MEAAKINIQVNFNQIVEAVKQMTPEERLIWNDVIRNEDTPIPVEHQQLVMKRVIEARKYPETMLDWDEVSKELL
jgi:hypothetical protein